MKQAGKGQIDIPAICQYLCCTGESAPQPAAQESPGQQVGGGAEDTAIPRAKCGSNPTKAATLVRLGEVLPEKSQIHLQGVSAGMCDGNRKKG